MHATVAQYINATADQNISNVNLGTIWGNGCSFYDFNHDGWDDLSMAYGAQEPQFFINNQGEFQAYNFGQINAENKQVKGLHWVDWDNDGDSDLMITRNNGSLKLLENNGSLQLTDITATSGISTESYAYIAPAWADYDHDGFLDFYIAKYYFGANFQADVFASVLYKGNGDGTFTDATVEAGVFLSPRATFQAVWFDYDSDGWQDLYLVIDRYTWTNELYKNNGDGTFTNVTVQSNSSLFINAMTGTIGDYDNDLDFDVYITNGFDGNHLMQNQGDGTFIDVSEIANIQVYDFCWGANWIDYDNDTWQDLFVCATGINYGPNQNQFLINDQNGTFHYGEVETGIWGDMGPTFVNAIGDMNNDGYYDYFNMNNQPIESDLWKSIGGENHWLSIELQGTVSNRDAFGALITLHCADHSYVRYTHGGESYMNQNSGKEIFGLAAETFVDSLEILWPRGLHEVYYNMPADQFMHFTEGESLNMPIATNASSNSICPGDSATLSIEGFELIVWSDSTYEETITANEEGSYFATVMDLRGNLFYTVPAIISNFIAPDVAVSDIAFPCVGLLNGSISLVILNDMEVSDVSWNDASLFGIQIDNLPYGDYVFQLTDQYGCMHEGNVELPSAPLPDISIEANDLACFGNNSGSISLTISNTIEWTDLTWNEGAFLGNQLNNLAAGEYAYSLMDEYECSHIGSTTITQPNEIAVTVATTNALCYNQASGSVALNIEGGTPAYQVNWNDLNPQELLADTYSVQVIDSNDCMVEVSFEITEPEELILEVSTTNQIEEELGNASVIITGGIEPYNINWSNDSTDVFEISDLMAGTYQVIVFDWNGCQAEYTFDIDFVESIGDNELEHFTIWPNPVQEILQVSYSGDAHAYRIVDVMGHTVIEGILHSNVMVDVSRLSSGLYHFMLINESVEYGAFIKQ